MKKALFSLLLTIACIPVAFGQRPAAINVSNESLTACGSYTWIDGNIYTADTIVTYLQGDTLYVLDLTVDAPRIDTASAIPVAGACSAEWNGKRWNTAGIFFDTIRIAGQCDSVVKVEITLSGVDSLESEVATACDRYVTSWGDTLTNSVQATDMVVVANGCNLTVGQLDITVLQSDSAATEERTVMGCSLMWNGIEIDMEDSVYYYSLTAANGCDSVVSIKVTSFSGNTHDTTSVVACDFYVHGDDTVTTDTVITTVDTNGTCHAYHSIVVTIDHSFRDTANVVVLDTVGGCNLVWFGRTYTSADLNNTLLAYSTTALGGCDSLVAIRITKFTDTNHVYNSVEYCGRYTWSHGGRTETLETSGEYLDTTASNGCTTVNHLMLTIKDNYDTIAPDSACASYTYTFDSRRGVAGVKDTAFYTVSGEYDQDQNGEDLYSVHFATRCVTHHHVIVKIKSPEQRYAENDIDTVVCDEFRFTFNGVQQVWTESADSTLVNSRRTMRNCYDYTGHVKVVVNKKAHDTTTVSACDNYRWVANDVVYSRSTTAEITRTDTTTAEGCAVLSVLNLTVNYTPVVTIEGDWTLENTGTPQSTTLTAVCDEPVTYKWYKGNETTPACTESVYEVTGITNNIDIHLESTSGNGCVANNWITITYNVGIDELDAIAVNIYPNPASRYLNIESAESLKGIVIFNAIGQQVIVRNVDGNRATLDLGGLSSGNYTLRITSANGEQVTRKFIVNK